VLSHFSTTSGGTGLTNEKLSFKSDNTIEWHDGSSWFGGTIDIGLARDSAGVLRVTDGSTGVGDLTAGDLNVDGINVGGHIIPDTDIAYDLGENTTPLRWRAGYFGTDSLHIASTAAETTTARDFSFQIETSGPEEGNLRLVEGATDLVTVTPAGNVGIGVTGPTFPLDVYGWIRTDDTAANGIFLYRNGSEIGRIWTSENNLDMRATNDVTLWTASTKRVHINIDGTIGVGTDPVSGVQMTFAEATRQFRFLGNSNVRFESDGKFAFYNTGGGAQGVLTRNLVVSNDYADTPPTNGIFTKGVIHGPDGTQTDPTYSFDSESNTGMYLVAAGQLAFVTDASEAIRINDTQQILMGTSDVSGGSLLTVSGTVSASNPTLDVHLATKSYVDSLIQGLNWQAPVILDDLTDPPSSPTNGDGYVVGGELGEGIATGAWAGKEEQIARWEGSGWDFTIPDDGYAVWVTEKDYLIVYNSEYPGGHWIQFGSTTTHSNLLGLSADDHTQYLRVDGYRGMTGNLNPDTDLGADLGTDALRWGDIKTGPGSFHVISTVAETTTARDFSFQIETTGGGEQGYFRIMEGVSDLVTITPAGYVGLGTTTNPTTPLQVGGVALISQVGLGAGNSQLTLNYGVTAARFTPPTPSTHSLIVRGASAQTADIFTVTDNGSTTDYLLVDSGGNVGLSRSTPAARLDIKSGAVGAAGGLRMEANASSNAIAYLFESSAAVGRLLLYDSGSVGVFLRGDGDCYVPNAFRVGAASSAEAGQVQWTGSNFQGYTGSAWVNLDTQGGSPGGSDTQLQYNDGGSTFGGADVYYNDANGNVGIGAASTGARLRVENASGGLDASNYLVVAGDTSTDSHYPGILLEGGTLATTYAQYSISNGGLRTIFQSGYSGTYDSYPNWTLNSGTSGNAYAAWDFSGTEVMRLTDAGRLGLGTTTVPHGGIGSAMLALDGPDASASGPHIQATTASDDYPVFQQFNYSHDSVGFIFDAFYDGAWKSSDAGSNFLLYKISDELRMGYDSGNAQGAAVSWTYGFFFDTSGNLGLGASSTGARLRVYNTGGTTPSNYLVIAGDGTDSHYPGLELEGGTLATTNYPQWFMSNGGLTTIFASGSSATYDQRARLLLYSHSSGNAYTSFDFSGTEKMRITDAGNLGIGTITDPQETIHASGALIVGAASNTNAGTIQWTGSNFQGYTGSTWLDLDSQGSVEKVGTPANNQIAVWTGDGTLEGTSDFTYDGSGFLSLSVSGLAMMSVSSSSGNGVLRCSSTTGDAYLTMYNVDGGVQAWTVGVDRSNGNRLIFGNSTTLASNSVMSMEYVGAGDGRIGINVTQPQEAIDCNGAIRLSTAENTNNGTVQWDGSNLQVRHTGEWVNLDESLPAGSDTQIQFNDSGALGANSRFTYNSTSKLVQLARQSGDGSGDAELRVYNQYVDATSDAILRAQTLAGGGDSLLLLTVGGDHFYLGMDNSDSENLKLGYGTTVGSNLALSIAPSATPVLYIPNGMGVGVSHVTGTKLSLPLEDDAVTPTLAFGDGDTGLYESQDDWIGIAAAGSRCFYINSSQVSGDTSGSGTIMNEAASTTNPTLVPSWPDYDTGIGSGGADELSLITGGVERLHISSDGYIGIGTNDPSYLLDITSNDDGNQSMQVHIGEQTDEGGYIGSYTPSDLLLSGGADFLDGSWVDRTPDGNVSCIRLLNGNITFNAENSWSAGAIPTQIMKIDGYYGRVGIGETSPSYNLHITSAGDAAIFLEADTGNDAEDNNCFVKFSQDNTGVQSIFGHVGNAGYDPENNSYTNTLGNALLIGTTTSNSVLQLGTNDAVRMTIGLNGEIGIPGQVYQGSITTYTPTGTTQTIDWDNGNVQTLDLESATGNVTLTLSNPEIGASYILKIIQDSTTSRNVVWPAAVKWQGGTAPTISTGANAVDVITLLYDGTNYYANFGQDYQ
jgi:hypothetical protein